MRYTTQRAIEREHQEERLNLVGEAVRVKASGQTLLLGVVVEYAIKKHEEISFVSLNATRSQSELQEREFVASISFIILVDIVTLIESSKSFCRNVEASGKHKVLRIYSATYLLQLDCQLYQSFRVQFLSVKLKYAVKMQSKQGDIFY